MRTISFAAIFLSCFVFSQQNTADQIIRKNIIATKVTQAPKIDGILQEEVWQNIAVAKDFVEKNPQNGRAENPEFRTEVKVLYDDTGVYFGAKMYDPNPDLIAKELVERDDIGNDDFFNIVINGYNDHQQSLEFMVMPSGVQLDGKINDEEEDIRWSAVWQSAVRITDFGWTAEVKIPYSELRFPNKNVQTWGINFVRLIRRSRTKTTWNFVDNTKGSMLLYDGTLSGIKYIKTPVRLSFLPYFSTYLNNYKGENSISFNGGLDVKYGINDAFTLDTTLVPDFGQAGFDETILNLGPFEQQFTEKRSFFTEGTELFSKGNLFYSRRVGDFPSRAPNLEENESLVTTIEKVKLLNATKISGRTNKGLGIGVFNAISKKEEVRIKNNMTGTERNETLEPLSNYNVFVLDQRFNGNSSATLINTNVTRAGDFQDANVTAFLVDLKDKKNKYNLISKITGSFVNGSEKQFGSDFVLGAGKIYGKNRFELIYESITKNYNIDDLGYTGETNFFNTHFEHSYNLLQPNKKFNMISLRNNLNYARRLDTDLFKVFDIQSNLSLQDKKFRFYSFGVHIYPFGENDLYEPRTFGRYLFIPASINPYYYFTSDNRKKFSFNYAIDYYMFDQKGRNRMYNELGFNYRFSDHFSAGYNGSSNISNQEQGYVDQDGQNIYIGTRNRVTVSNSISSQYAFNSRMSLSLNLRYYYTEVNYKNTGILQEDGRVTNIANLQTPNQTYNAWNVDLRYAWYFAPGSQLTFLYQNAITSNLPYSRINLKNNFSNLFNEAGNNTLSLKITYYLDYQKIKSIFN